jgi:hypothetical protein
MYGITLSNERVNHDGRFVIGVHIIDATSTNTDTVRSTGIKRNQNDGIIDVLPGGTGLRQKQSKDQEEERVV